MAKNLIDFVQKPKDFSVVTPNEMKTKRETIRKPIMKYSLKQPVLRTTGITPLRVADNPTPRGGDVGDILQENLSLGGLL